MVSGAGTVVLYLLGPAVMYGLGPTAFSQLAHQAQMVVQQVWAINNDTLNTNLEKDVVKAEQKIAELTTSNNALNEDLTRVEAAKVSTRLVKNFLVCVFDIDTFRPRLWPGLTS